ncbi:MAG: biotin transporter BioY, partial [Oscillatoriales cyanobacterium]
MPAPIELIWAVIGLLLTIGGTFLPASVTMPIGFWDDRGLQAYSLGVTYQIGAV